MGIPTGTTSDIVQQFYDYLFSRYLQVFPIHVAEGISGISSLQILSWAFVLIVIFFLYAYLFNVHRTHGELYGTTSFAGSILERNGRVDVFTWFIVGGLLIAAIYLAIKYMYVGYIY